MNEQERYTWCRVDMRKKVFLKENFTKFRALVLIPGRTYWLFLKLNIINKLKVFWYPIGSLHRFKFLLYTSEHPSVKKWSWCFITCRYINIALKWSRNTHHILKSQIWRFLDILSNNLFCINGVWPVVCHLFRGATRRGQNLMNSCTFLYLLWWRGCESNFYAVFRFNMLGHVVLKLNDDMNYTNHDPIEWVREHDKVKSSDFSRFRGYPCSTPCGVMTKRGIMEISKIWDLKTSLKRHGI